MAASANRRFRLEARFGVDCDAGGVTLAGVPLLRRTRQGWRPRSGLELRFLLERAYRKEIDSERLEQKLDRIAQALDEGTVTRAMIGALLLNVPELDRDGAARLARAEDTLTKFDPDEPRDAAGRWTTDGDGDAPSDRSPAPLRLVSDRADPATAVTGARARHDLQTELAATPWAQLPPGERIDELGDLLEWAANATPADAPAIRGEIKRHYYDAGDTRGGDALNQALSDGLEARSLAERQSILETYEPYTHEDPAKAAQLRDLINEIALLTIRPPAGLRTPTAPTRTGRSPVWDLPPTARGDKIHEEFGANLPHNFPVIDREADGIVTSIKSIDLSAPTYQNALRLLRRLNRYVDQLAEFEGTTWANRMITKSDIKGRELRVVVPRGLRSSNHEEIFSSTQKRAEDLGIEFNIVDY